MIIIISASLEQRWVVLVYTMKFQRAPITLIIFLLTALVVQAQGRRVELHLDFRVNKTHLDSTYGSNPAHLQQIRSFLEEIHTDSSLVITKVYLYGGASPEASYQVNRRLADRRMALIESLVCQELNVPDSLIVRWDGYIPWKNLGRKVSASSMAEAEKEEILAVISMSPRMIPYYRGGQIDERVIKLKRLNQGQTWQHLYEQYFPDMRSAMAVVMIQEAESALQPMQGAAVFTNEQARVDSTEAVEIYHPEPTPAPAAKLHWYLKTNFVELGMLVGNAAVEFDLSPRWSVNIPITYSGLDYFHSTTKFRTLGIQPEVRFWPQTSEKGLFIGAHAGVGYYNIAYNDDYRYQDQNGRRPAWGGGLGLGYRFHLSKSHRWQMELSVGAGVYDVRYDIFHNVNNGRYDSTVHDTYIGLDQVNVSISYRIPYKGGAR